MGFRGSMVRRMVALKVGESEEVCDFLFVGGFQLDVDDDRHLSHFSTKFERHLRYQKERLRCESLYDRRDEDLREGCLRGWERGLHLQMFTTNGEGTYHVTLHASQIHNNVVS